MRTDFDVGCGQELTLSPEAYLRLRAEDPDVIQSAVMLPPKIGKEHHFGKMRVSLSVPLYEVRRKRYV